MIFLDILSDSTPISLGLLLAIVGLIGACIWWAANIQGKLDTLIKLLASIHKDIDHLHTKIEAHDHRITVLEIKSRE